MLKIPVYNAIKIHKSSFLLIDNHSIISATVHYDLNILKHVLQNVKKILSKNEINVHYKCLSNNV